MNSELLLNFSDTNRVTVSLDGSAVKAVDFESPIVKEEFQDLRWYLETYASQYTADVDDERAGRIVVQLKDLGQRLFDSVFMDRASSRLFDHFLNARQTGRVLTINASQPEILALPWELLRVPGRGAYMFTENPQISVRRNLSQSLEGYLPTQFKPKPKLRVLVVASRPKDAGWLDPRADGLALMNAADRHGQGRIEVEFLRPGTFEALVNRLNNTDLPPIDILHFDGHGAFDKTGFFNKGGESELLKKGEGKNMGYLLFEKADGTQNPVSADRLGQFLNQQGLGLVLLSACQSSLVLSDQEAEQDSNGIIGSVAARLTQTGVPAVIAMSYSVLAKTTERLFGEFYGSLVRGEGIGSSLDNARRHLLMNPDRGNRQRGQEQITLRVEDWFVPTLYQLGRDPGMVLVGSASAEDGKPAQTLLIGQGMPKELEVGFFGRRRELWAIEKAFTPKPHNPKQETRRVTIAGFGGQGKTALAAEAGRWLVRSGMFDAITFVDYQACQNIDAISVAVSTIARDLEVNLINADAVTAELKRRRVLVILDNLEDVSEQAQKELLTAAIAWSEAGQSRVLITTRQDTLGHGRYGRSGFEHQLIELKGLGTVAYPEDTIDYFQALMQVPPQPAKMPVRKALIALFTKVDFHPLSIGLVAEQLRTRNIVDVDQALDRLLAEVPAGQSKDRSLIASLNLSLDRLDGEARQLVKQLGIFQGGALESQLQSVTKISSEQWQTLRQHLASIGLIQAETLEGTEVPFFRFHPTFSQVMWSCLTEEEQAELQGRHRYLYYMLAVDLYVSDREKVYSARAIAKRELFNLLAGVKSALSTKETWAVNFVDKVNKFLNNFGMPGEQKNLTQQAEKAIQNLLVGSQEWYLAKSNVGKVLTQEGYFQAAMEIFEEILVGLGEVISYQRCLTLSRLGRCWSAMGKPEQSVKLYYQELDELTKLDPNDRVKRLFGTVQGDLADVLRDIGDYEAARKAYEASLDNDQELGDQRGVAVAYTQLGTLSMIEGKFSEAEALYKSALGTFQTLDENDHKAIIWHQLGNLYQKTQQWQQAESAYRTAAQLKESQGNWHDVIKTWICLANVIAAAGKLEESENWSHKAIAAAKLIGDNFLIQTSVNNIASLLQKQGKVTEAVQFAEESIKISTILDPSVAKIWTTYNILAKLSAQQGEVLQAQNYRRLSRQSFLTYAGSRLLLKQWEESIHVIVKVIMDRDAQHLLEALMPRLEKWNDGNLIRIIQRMHNGERNEETLCEELNWEDWLIVTEILRQLSS